MEISSINSYGAISSSQTSTTQSVNSNSFDTYLKNQTQETIATTTKKETFKVVAFLDKYDSFSSLSSTDEKIFREILADDKYTMEEMQSLDYEQVKKFGNFLESSLYGSGVSAYEIPLAKCTDLKAGAMLYAVKITDNEEFNKALFQTVQTIDDQMEMMNFFSRLSDSLGWNDKTCLIPERDDPELRKDSSNEDWEIKSYKRFIEANIKELNELLRNPIIDNEEKESYRTLLNDFLILQKNHDEVKNKARYTY